MKPTRTSETPWLSPDVISWARCATTRPPGARRPRRTVASKSRERVMRAAAGSTTSRVRLPVCRGPCGGERTGSTGRRAYACADGTRASCDAGGCWADRCASLERLHVLVDRSRGSWLVSCEVTRTPTSRPRTSTSRRDERSSEHIRAPLGATPPNRGWLGECHSASRANPSRAQRKRASPPTCRTHQDGPPNADDRFTIRGGSREGQTAAAIVSPANSDETTRGVVLLTSGLHVPSSRTNIYGHTVDTRCYVGTNRARILDNPHASRYFLCVPILVDPLVVT